MVRYYFHTEDGRVCPDEEGTELPSLVAARVEAVRVLGDILKEDPGEVLRTGALRVTVTDKAGLIFFALDLSAIDTAAAERPVSG